MRQRTAPGRAPDSPAPRKWNNLLYDGGTVFEAGGRPTRPPGSCCPPRSPLADAAAPPAVPPLLRIVRDVEDERMQLYSPEGALLADVDRRGPNSPRGAGPVPRTA